MSVKEEPFYISDINGNAKNLDDFIYNRFDLMEKGKAYFVDYKEGNENARLSFCVENNEIEIGVWLLDVKPDLFNDICDFLFRHFKSVRHIRFDYYLYKPLKRCEATKGNHWKLSLPRTADELLQRTTRKARYNLKREKRLIAENLGEYKVVEFTINDGLSPEAERVIEKYFEFKKISHGADYGLTPEQYVGKFFVTNIYVLYIKGEIGSVLFSCEQGDTVYLENLSYNPEHKKYSLGTVLYEEYLLNLIKKGKKVLYLGGGQQEYKSHFGSVEDVTYTGIIYRSSLEFFGKVKVNAFKNKIKRAVFSVLHRLKVFLNVRSRFKRLKNKFRARRELKNYNRLHSSLKDIIRSVGKHEKVMICAHPDDESLLFYNELRTDNSIFVICLSNQMNEVRNAEFYSALKEYGVEGRILNFPDFDYIQTSWNKHKLKSAMQLIKKYVSPSVIYTHNKEGEYGHIHHKLTHNAVMKVFDCNILSYAGVKSVENLDEKISFFEKHYKTQAVYSWHKDIFENDGTIKVK